MIFIDIVIYPSDTMATKDDAYKWHVELNDNPPIIVLLNQDHIHRMLSLPTVTHTVGLELRMLKVLSKQHTL